MFHHTKDFSKWRGSSSGEDWTTWSQGCERIPSSGLQKSTPAKVQSMASGTSLIESLAWWTGWSGWWWCSPSSAWPATSPRTCGPSGRGSRWWQPWRTLPSLSPRSPFLLSLSADQESTWAMWRTRFRRTLSSGVMRMRRTKLEGKRSAKTLKNTWEKLSRLIKNPTEQTKEIQSAFSTSLTPWLLLMLTPQLRPMVSGQIFWLARRPTWKRRQVGIQKMKRLAVAVHALVLVLLPNWWATSALLHLRIRNSLTGPTLKCVVRNLVEHWPS